MENSKIVDIYQNASSGKTENFRKNTESTLHVKTDYEKVIRDIDWIEMMEGTIPYLDNIFRAPNRFIINEEEIVKIERARRITVESIKNLSKNTNFIQEVDKKTGDVKPSKILNIDKEESYDTYENRLIYTLVQNMKFFLSVKKKTLEQLQGVGNKNDKKIAYSGTSRVGAEKININLTMDTQKDGNSSGGSKKDVENPDNLLQRISDLEVRISDLTNADVYKVIDKKHIALVREPIKKTNVVLKNVNFQYAMKLWDYLRDNLDDKTKNINEKKDYEESGELKELMDDSFLLNYLIINTLDKDKEEDVHTEERKKEIQNIIISKMLEKIVEMNQDLTKEQIKEMIGEKYLVIKRRNQASLQEIQAVFSKSINKYLTKVK